MFKIKIYTIFFIILFLQNFAFSSSPQPYIDRLKQKMTETDAVSSDNKSYTETIKTKLNQNNAQSQTSEGYTDKIKAHLSHEQEMPVQGSYTQEEKLKLKSKSIPHERKGKIKSAIAIKLNVSANKNITASDSLRPFQDIYGSKWAPELGMAYELKPMYSEWFGSVGIVFSVGFGFHEGIGIFKKALVNNKTGTAFASESQTRFKFFTIPIGAGLNYRFNLLRILRPYIQAQGALIGFIETRSDEQKNKRGFSKCALTSGGINLLLDWFSKNFDWDIYEESGIKHSYLTLDYTKVFTYSSNVAFNASSWNLGFTYEF